MSENVVATLMGGSQLVLLELKLFVYIVGNQGALVAFKQFLETLTLTVFMELVYSILIQTQQI